MSLKYDAVLILSSNPPDRKILTPTAISRLKKGLEIYCCRLAGAIALSGSLSDKMYDYLLANSIKSEHIFHEGYSRDTVGNLVFAELLMRRNNCWNSMALVSSEFHLKRIKKIRDSLYPGKFNMDFFGVKANWENAIFLREHEESSLMDFERDFGNVKPWDDMEIIHRLIDVHRAYRNLEQKEQLRSRLMRAL